MRKWLLLVDDIWADGQLTVIPNTRVQKTDPQHWWKVPLEDEMLWLHASFSSELLSQTSEIKMIFQEIVLNNYNKEAGYKKYVI